MKCANCGQEYGHTFSQCPFCGAAPGQAGPQYSQSYAPQYNGQPQFMDPNQPQYNNQPAPAAKKSSTGLIIGIIAAVVAIAVAVVLVIVLGGKKDDKDSSGSSKEGSAKSSVQTVTTLGATVQIPNDFKKDEGESENTNGVQLDLEMYGNDSDTGLYLNMRMDFSALSDDEYNEFVTYMTNDMLFDMLEEQMGSRLPNFTVGSKNGDTMSFTCNNNNGDDLYGEFRIYRQNKALYLMAAVLPNTSDGKTGVSDIYASVKF